MGILETLAEMLNPSPTYGSIMGQLDRNNTWPQEPGVLDQMRMVSEAQRDMLKSGRVSAAAKMADQHPLGQLASSFAGPIKGPKNFAGSGTPRLGESIGAGTGDPVPLGRPAATPAGGMAISPQTTRAVNSLDDLKAHLNERGIAVTKVDHSTNWSDRYGPSASSYLTLRLPDGTTSRLRASDHPRVTGTEPTDVIYGHDPSRAIGTVLGLKVPVSNAAEIERVSALLQQQPTNKTLIRKLEMLKREH